MLILPEIQCAAYARARIPFTGVSEISSLMGSSNWPCISITLEANWFPSVSHLYNWAFANHLKMHVRERDDSVKEIHFSFILLVIHTTEYVIVRTIKEIHFKSSLASQNTHYLGRVFCCSPPPIRHYSNISLNNNMGFGNIWFCQILCRFLRGFSKRHLTFFLAI